MQPFTPEALAHFETHHGIASRSELLAAGLSRHTIRRMVETANLREVVKGVYHLPAAPLDELARCAAICAAHPDLAISGPTAGRFWGLRRLPGDRRIHVISPPASRPTNVAWVVPHRTAAIRDDDLVRRADGIVVTSRARTALDLARVVPSGDLCSIVEQVMADGRHSPDDLRRVAVDWLSPGRPWVRRFLLALDQRVAGGAAESHGEVVVGAALERAGVRGLVRQFQIDLPGYGPARFDLAVPARYVAIEVDLFPTHREQQGRRRDAWRDRAARELGWTVERIVESDLGAALHETAARLARSVHSTPRQMNPLTR